MAGLGRLSCLWAADRGDLFHGWGLLQMNVHMLSPRDAAQYRQVMLHAYGHAADAFTSTPQERAAEPLSWWANRLGSVDGLSVAFGVRAGDALTGVLALEFSSRTKTRHKALLVGMYVMPDWRGQGLARALIRGALAHAEAREHITVVQLEVTEGNVAAIALYQSLGFQSYGVEPMAVLTPTGYRNKVHMWLELSRT
jgi:ribosomal protein S18 acetylase RimI-like enzyme